jgi:hypothetical protein
MKIFVLRFTAWQSSQLHTVRVTKWHTLLGGEGDWKLSEEEKGSLTSFACSHTPPQFHDCLHLVFKLQATNHAMGKITVTTMSFVTWRSFFRARPGRMAFLLGLQNAGKLTIQFFQTLEPREVYSFFILMYMQAFPNKTGLSHEG